MRAHAILLTIFTLASVAFATDASMRARRARNLLQLNLCPSDYTACQLPNSRGWECVDTNVSLPCQNEPPISVLKERRTYAQNNLEMCGGCEGDAKTVDCTQLAYVEAVGCIAGRCEVGAHFLRAALHVLVSDMSSQVRACSEGYALNPMLNACFKA